MSGKQRCADQARSVVFHRFVRIMKVTFKNWSAADSRREKGAASTR
ncbi:hypothetical protein BURPS1106B_2259 [Burkholderia pseudomallei 1106b]|uniref:Uncharacterized protein n=2 Tax=Burkholderia pseudomallei TaxID=28450 RepID=A0A0E1VT15_BURPE|nr:hypothetical protein BURPS1106A_A2915 [Burkholderia pseudomallei 1106a]EBA46858.1 conserved hypothetical protein [Burkholderia pseudomallei 305]EEC32657.1 conserved hypothetical protein [Burkholderia pseudomallei 576]EEH29848.1 conserved hypothetical protein [Burkholderia pseudomallei Pakistan 9]EEP50897.1 conserved hypothetical protein [Burkholderia pseudomallei MSHR346]EES22233.1 hypothetical protein BURPS1106B_2259 [Burkholderia pseudomallei 1106b]EET04060.1 hypothetical protein BURPS17